MVAGGTVSDFSGPPEAALKSQEKSGKPRKSGARHFAFFSPDRLCTRGVRKGIKDTPLQLLRCNYYRWTTLFTRAWLGPPSNGPGALGAWARGPVQPRTLHRL